MTGGDKALVVENTGGTGTCNCDRMEAAVLPRRRDVHLKSQTTGILHDDEGALLEDLIRSSYNLPSHLRTHACENDRACGSDASNSELCGPWSCKSNQETRLP